MLPQKVTIFKADICWTVTWKVQKCLLETEFQMIFRLNEDYYFLSLKGDNLPSDQWPMLSTSTDIKIVYTYTYVDLPVNCKGFLHEIIEARKLRQNICSWPLIVNLILAISPNLFT
jgi:hypothetical protein